MKERPILYSGEMVRAIPQKTQTRRICKVRDVRGQCFSTYGKDAIAALIRNHCPYGKVGDRLWVREAWRTGKCLDRYSPKEIEKQANEAGYLVNPGRPCPIRYEADKRSIIWGDNDLEDFGDWGRYRHGRFMPRWASRITLEITNIKVERVQDISANDAVSEGCPDLWLDKYPNPIGWFQRLWDEVNGKGAWERNDWVWVLEFRKVDG